MRLPSKTVWLAFFIHTLIIFTSYLLADILPSHLPAGFIDHSLYPMSSSLEKLVKWDAHWYTYVAGHGYDAKSIVFFPFLIMIMKFLSALGLHIAFAGLLICNVFAFVSFWIMDLTFRLDFSKEQVHHSLLSYALMPTSFFLNSIYTESIFITLSLFCIYFIRRGQWWYGGIAGAFATLTRNLGIFLFIFLLYEFFKKKPQHSKSSCILIALFLPAFALSCFMLYNLYLLGDPIAFVNSQKSWGRYFELPWHNIWANIPLTISNNPYSQPGIALDTVLVISSIIGLFFLTFLPSFKIPVSYLLIGWIWLFIPLCSTAPGLPLYSMSRFILPIFPLYLFFGQLPTKIFYCWLFLSGSTLLLCTALFINWYWIG
jgi:Gpi18-like mannosyltransferase